MFNVTMQNHGGYSEDEPAVDVTVMPVDKELQTPQMLEYLSLIRESDAAFKELTDYFSEAEEDTVILMFGDHQPSMDEGVSEFMDQKLEERDGELDSQRRYYASFTFGQILTFRRCQMWSPPRAFCVPCCWRRRECP